MDSAFNRKRVILMFLLPAFILYTAVVIVSIVWSTCYSFFDWDGMGKMTFIGIKNFINLYTMDKNFWPVVTNTLIYTVLEISLQVFGGLLIAIFLTRVTRGRATLQTFYYMPVVISSVAISQIFNKLFSVTPTGLINAILGWLNAEWLTLEWISNPKTSLALCAFVEGYKYAGYIWLFSMRL